MEHLLSPPLDRKGYSYYGSLFLARGSIWRTSVYTPRSCCSFGVDHVSAAILSWHQNPKGNFFFSRLCHSVQTVPPRVTDTSDSNGSPAWEMPRDLIYLISIFLPSQARLVALMPSPICPLSLPAGIRDGGTAPAEE